MPLILQPSLTDADVAAIELHLATVRGRRLEAAITYQQGVNAKLDHKLAVAQRRIDQKSSQLAKAIGALDKADRRCARLTQELTMLLSDAGLVRDLLSTNQME